MFRSYDSFFFFSFFIIILKYYYLRTLHHTTMASFEATCNTTASSRAASVASTASSSSCSSTLDKYDASLPLPPVLKFNELVGNTPLVDLTHLLVDPKNPETKVYAKCEFFNPGFSIKDRIVRGIFDEAERRGDLRPGMTVVAASSGNTGASTAMMCAMRGYPCIITTSTKCSVEKMNAIKAYGAKLLVSPPGVKEGDAMHYMEMARTLAKEAGGEVFDVDQYDTQSNPQAHFDTLGPEIWAQTGGAITHFVAAGSTGGTISGTGRYLKTQSSDVNVVLADPVGSIFAEYFRSRTITKPKKFLVEGVGKGSIPGAMHFDVVDDICVVSDQEAFDMCSYLARNEGICAGGSSGLNVHAALKVAAASEEAATVVTVMPDLGVKYLSKVYNGKWLAANGVIPRGLQARRATRPSKRPSLAPPCLEDFFDYILLYHFASCTVVILFLIKNKYNANTRTYSLLYL